MNMNFGRLNAEKSYSILGKITNFVTGKIYDMKK